jgi:hypothetical protein
MPVASTVVAGGLQLRETSRKSAVDGRATCDCLSQQFSEVTATMM